MTHTFLPEPTLIKSINTFCFWSFFLDSFFLSGSSARANACSFSTRVIWQKDFKINSTPGFKGYFNVKPLPIA